MDKYYVLTFQNTHGAISAENILKEENIKIDIMPTPTSITKSCGISIRFNGEYLERIKELLKTGEINIKDAYVKDGPSYNSIDLL